MVVWETEEAEEVGVMGEGLIKVSALAHGREREGIGRNLVVANFLGDVLLLTILRYTRTR